MSATARDSFTTEEGWHTIKDDGMKLYTKTWKPKGAVVAKLLLIHGFTDQCNHFDEFFQKLTAVGIQCHGLDQRGWGRSVKKPSQRGLTGYTDRVLADMTDVASSLFPSDVPVFMYGHSMGGAQTLTYAATAPSDMLRKFRGFIAEAPLVGLSPATKPWGITVAAGRIAGRLLPTLQMLNELDPYLLSHDRMVCEEYKRDPLVHNFGTLQGLAGMLDRGINLEKGKIQIKNTGDVRSVLLCHGTGDGITHAPASEKFMREYCHVKDKEYRPYDGWYHVMHDEAGDDKDKYAKDIAAWILQRLN